MAKPKREKKIAHKNIPRQQRIHTEMYSTDHNENSNL